MHRDMHQGRQSAEGELKHYRERITKVLQQGAAGGRIHKPCHTLPVAAAGMQANGSSSNGAESAVGGDASLLD